MGINRCYCGTILLVFVLNLNRMTSSSFSRSAPKSSAVKSEVDSEESRKVLGSSVVTSVSVVMNHDNETQAFFTDKIDGPELKINLISSPGNLLNPDRYEFYTFDGTGDLVKRLMTWDEIQGLIAGSDTDNVLSDAVIPIYYSESTPDKTGVTHLTANDFQTSDEHDVHKVVESVQNVLKSELVASQSKILPAIQPSPMSNLPNWSVLLPNFFENIDEVGVADLHQLSNSLVISNRHNSSSVHSNNATNHAHHVDSLLKSTASPQLAISTTIRSSGKTTTINKHNAETTEKPIRIESTTPKLSPTWGKHSSIAVNPNVWPQTLSAFPFSSSTTSITAKPSSATSTATATTQQLHDFYTSDRDLFTAITNLLNQVNGQQTKIDGLSLNSMLTNYNWRNTTPLSTKPSFFIHKNENHDASTRTTPQSVDVPSPTQNGFNNAPTIAEMHKYGTYFTSAYHDDHGDTTLIDLSRNKSTSSSLAIHDFPPLRKQSTSTVKSTSYTHHTSPTPANYNQTGPTPVPVPVPMPMPDVTDSTTSFPHKYHNMANHSTKLGETATVTVTATTTTTTTRPEPLVTWTSAYPSNEIQDNVAENNEIGFDKLVTEQYVSGSNEKLWIFKDKNSSYKNNNASTGIFTFSPSTEKPNQQEISAKVTTTRSTWFAAGEKLQSHRITNRNATNSGDINHSANINTTDTKTTTPDQHSPNVKTNLHRIPTIDAESFAESKTATPNQHKYATLWLHQTRPSTTVDGIIDIAATKPPTIQHSLHGAIINIDSDASITATEKEMQRIPTIDPQNKTNAQPSISGEHSSTKSSYHYSSTESTKNLTQIAIMLNKSNETVKYPNKIAEKHRLTVKPNSASPNHPASRPTANEIHVDSSPTTRPAINTSFFNDCVASIFSASKLDENSSSDASHANHHGNGNTVIKTENRLKNASSSDDYQTQQALETMKNDSSSLHNYFQKFPPSDRQKENSHIYYYKLPPITSPQAFNVTSTTVRSVDQTKNDNLDYANRDNIGDSVKTTLLHTTMSTHHRKPNSTSTHQNNWPSSTTASDLNDKQYEKVTTLQHAPQQTPPNAANTTVNTNNEYSQTDDQDQLTSDDELLRSGLSTVTNYLLQTEKRILNKYGVAQNVTPYRQIFGDHPQNREALEENAFVSAPSTTNDNHRVVAEKNNAFYADDVIDVPTNQQASNLHVYNRSADTSDVPTTLVQINSTTSVVAFQATKNEEDKRTTVFTDASASSSSPNGLRLSTGGNALRHQINATMPLVSTSTSPIPLAGESNFGNHHTPVPHGNGNVNVNVTRVEQTQYNSRTITTTEFFGLKNHNGVSVDERNKYAPYVINRTQTFKNQNQNFSTNGEDLTDFRAPTAQTNVHFGNSSATGFEKRTVFDIINTTASTVASAEVYASTGRPRPHSDTEFVKVNLENRTTTNTQKDEKSKIDDSVQSNKSASAASTNSTVNPYPTGAFRSPINSSVRSSTVAPNAALELHPAPHENMGLEASITYLGDDVKSFVDLCNELSFKTWTTQTGKSPTTSRSMVLSPFALLSNLAMIFLGARGSSSGIMNDFLRLDDMVTFNPHQVFRNVTESVVNAKNIGVANAAFVREIFSDKAKGNVLEFYKERLQQYYDTHIEEINFNIIGDLVRRRTNLQVKRQTQGRIQDYLKGSTLTLKPPLAVFTANILQTHCDTASTDGRDGEMYFVVRPSNRQRRLIPIPAVVYRGGFLAGYEPGLDATAVTLSPESVISTVFVLPGQQGQVAPGDGLARLEQRLLESSYRRGAWSRLLRSLLFRQGLEVQLPRFSHKSILNLTLGLQRMGLDEIFSPDKADLRGINGLPNELHLSDIVQVNTFSMCGEETVGARHHIETFPSITQRARKNQNDFKYVYSEHDYAQHDYTAIPSNWRPKQARLPDNPRLRFDRPFLYLVRHNPTGMILYIGRFNPRLLP